MAYPPKNHQPRENNSKELPPTIEPQKLPADYVDSAERLMRELTVSSRNLTTTKLRTLFNLVLDVFNEEILRSDESLTAEHQAKLSLIRMRMVYEAGRDPATKYLVKRAKLLEYLKGVGSSRQDFINFTHYMESLVAYHRFFGGKE